VGCRDGAAPAGKAAISDSFVKTAGDLEPPVGERLRFQVCGFNPREPHGLFSLPRFVPMVGLKVCRRPRGHLTQTIKEQIQLEGKSVRK